MEEPQSNQEETTAKDAGLSPGEMLAQAREAQGLSRVRVSEILGLTQNTIRDIELCRFDKFPSGIYTRGYLRNYCKLVELDAEQVLAAYDKYGETHETPEESPFGSGDPASVELKSRGKLFVGIAVGVVLVILAGLILF